MAGILNTVYVLLVLAVAVVGVGVVLLGGAEGDGSRRWMDPVFAAVVVGFVAGLAILLVR